LLPAFGDLSTNFVNLAANGLSRLQRSAYPLLAADHIMQIRWDNRFSRTSPPLYRLKPSAVDLALSFNSVLQ